jgi:hypothetical protein
LVYPYGRRSSPGLYHLPILVGPVWGWRQRLVVLLLQGGCYLCLQQPILQPVHPLLRWRAASNSCAHTLTYSCARSYSGELSNHRPCHACSYLFNAQLGRLLLLQWLPWFPRGWLVVQSRQLLLRAVRRRVPLVHARGRHSPPGLYNLSILVGPVWGWRQRLVLLLLQSGRDMCIQEPVLQPVPPIFQCFPVNKVASTFFSNSAHARAHSWSRKSPTYSSICRACNGSSLATSTKHRRVLHLQWVHWCPRGWLVVQSRQLLLCTVWWRVSVVHCCGRNSPPWLHHLSVLVGQVWRCRQGLVFLLLQRRRHVCLQQPLVQPVHPILRWHSISNDTPSDTIDLTHSFPNCGPHRSAHLNPIDTPDHTGADLKRVLHLQRVHWCPRGWTLVQSRQHLLCAVWWRLPMVHTGG